MKIGVDIRSACGEKRGKGWYTFHLIKALLAQDAENEYVLYTDKLCAEAAHLHGVHIKILRRRGALWHLHAIREAERDKLDVFFAPTSFIVPAFLPAKIKSIITVHDLISMKSPLLHKTKAAIIENLLLRRALSRAAHVVVPSQHTKKDLRQLFKIDAAKISVTPLGVDELFNPKADPKDLEINKKYELPDEFILTVAGLEPRKNVAMLVKAVLALPASFKNAQLVIVGGEGWKSADVERLIRQNSLRVKHIKNCPPEDLPAFYRLAKIFVFPSLYEGFGLPPLEAMASGCPVICSSSSSLPEVCGDAAIMLDPKNAEAFTDAIKKLLRDDSLRKKMSAQGLAQAAKFSWNKTAKLTMEAMKTLTAD